MVNLTFNIIFQGRPLMVMATMSVRPLLLYHAPTYLDYSAMQLGHGHLLHLGELQAAASEPSIVLTVVLDRQSLQPYRPRGSA